MPSLLSVKDGTCNMTGAVEISPRITSCTSACVGPPLGGYSGILGDFGDYNGATPSK